jgi:hypothetical protein
VKRTRDMLSYEKYSETDGEMGINKSERDREMYN